MSRRITSASLVLIAVVTSWVLLDPGTTSSDRPVSAFEVEASQASPVAIGTEHARSSGTTAIHSTVGPMSLAEPLARQRDRLRRIESRLRVRRDQARASHAQEATLQAIENHLARVEQRLVALERLPG